MSYTVEEFPFMDQLLTLELDLEYSMSRYVPAVPPSLSHPGDPPEGGEIEELSVTVVHVEDEDGRVTCGDFFLAVQAEFDEKFDEQYKDKIEEYIHENHEEPERDDYDD
jgi:hypothetical protein